MKSKNDNRGCLDILMDMMSDVNDIVEKYYTTYPNRRK